ncbi:MAG: SLBB domain-containing protein [Gilvibacter sp.]
MISFKWNRTKNLTLIFCLFLSVFSALSQTIPTLSGNVEDLSDDQVKAYWEQAKAQGYTLEQLKSVAAARGVSATQIAELERRVTGLGSQEVGLEGSQIDNVLGIDDTNPVGLSGSENIIATEEDPLFGFSFFNNKNITFTPNLNLPTPANYQLGPGDEVVVNLWGAAQSTFALQVDRTGALRIPNLGPVFVSGMQLDEATAVLKTNMSRIYGGLQAANSSPYKINIDVNISKVRTVQVNIIGQVKVPGTYSLSALSNVLNGLYAAGGPTREGTFRKIKIIRNGQETVYFDLYKYFIEGSQVGNLTLQDQDLIVVSPYISRIDINGAVKRAGTFEILPEESLSDLLEYASGFTSTAYKDRIVLERIEDDQRVVRELLYSNAASSALKDGDRLQVQSIIDKYKNRVEIIGSVYRPGPYEYTNGLTVKDLIEKAAGLNEGTFMERGLLFRLKDDGFTRELISFDLSDVMDGSNPIALQPDDSVRLFNSSTLTDSYTISIDGAVRQPSRFPYIENMSVQDLVILAGGFSDDANPEVIDVFRRIKDDEFETLAETFRVNLDGSIGSASDGNFILMPNDRVSVRSLKGFGDQKTAAVEGEVNYPGQYTIASKNETILDLVNRAGGVSPYAFVEGASLIRQNPYYKEDLAIQQVTNIINDTTVAKSSLNNQKEFRVGINLTKILEEDGGTSKENMVLMNGDRLVIPSVKETVKVEGRVLVPSMVRFDKSMTLADYIEKSGGFATDAKKGKVYVIYSNGDIATTNNFLFFRSYPKLAPGALILVPQKPINPNRLSTQEVIGISTGLTTLGLLVDRLLR